VLEQLKDKNNGLFVELSYRNAFKIKKGVELLKISPLAGKIEFNLYICVPKNLY